MKTLTEKYNGVLEGNFSKEQFLRDARLTQPNFITQFNSYDEAVQILLNKSLISKNTPVVVEEKNTYTSTPVVNDEDLFSFETLQRGIQYEFEQEGIDSTYHEYTEEEYLKAKKKVITNLKKDPNYYLNQLKKDTKKEKENKLEPFTKSKTVDKDNATTKVQLKKVNEIKSKSKVDKTYLKEIFKKLITDILKEDELKDFEKAVKRKTFTLNGNIL